MDCRVASLLAMTDQLDTTLRASPRSAPPRDAAVKLALPVLAKTAKSRPSFDTCLSR